jgi:carbamoyl-phosphate synthase large subunit
MNKNILVTGIGGNVAQGILRNIAQDFIDIYIVGTNTNYLSAGNYLCDIVYELPFAWDNAYIPKMVEICQRHSIDLIIPSTDFEVYYLGIAQKYLPTIAACKPDVAGIFLNKYKTWEEFSQYQIPFANTCLPSEYHNKFNECIVKPSEGRGSRGIQINPPDASQFSNDYIVQELIRGKEITTAFYVTKSNELLGQITLARSLHDGATNSCEVVFDYDQQINSILKKIIDKFEIRGSVNLQSIVTSDMQIIPFEVNCRISGTNSIRANFGFHDVRYTIQEYLYNLEPEKPTIIKGSAQRILMDIIYPNTSLNEIENKSTKHFIF